LIFDKQRTDMPTRTQMMILTVLMAGSTWVLLAQEKPKTTGPIVRLLSASVDQNHSVTLHIQVSSPTKPLVVPACDRLPDGAESPCWIEIQTETPQGWQMMQPKYAKAGMEPLDKWSPRSLSPGSSRDFSYRFVRDEWKVRQGQRVRVVILAWKDEQSLKSPDKGIKLKTKPFACP
jgi:hypothetical protein